MDRTHLHGVACTAVCFGAALTLALAGCSSAPTRQSDPGAAGGESSERAAGSDESGQDGNDRAGPSDSTIPTQPAPQIAVGNVPTQPQDSPTSSARLEREDAALRYSPLTPAACEEILTTVENVLGTSAVLSEQPFLDYVDPSVGSGCAVVADGTGVDLGAIDGFPGRLGAANAVQSALGMLGWVADPSYGAGSPNAVGAGLRLGDALCLLVVRWQPSDDADCPAGKAFDECDLTPEQMRYHVEVNCAASANEEEASP